MLHNWLLTIVILIFLPGCGSNTGNKAEGEPCQKDVECAGTLECIDGKCAYPEQQCPQAACTLDMICQSHSCADGDYWCALIVGLPEWTHQTPWCDDQDPCTLDDQCSESGICTGQELVCTIIPADFCVNDSDLREYTGVGTCQAGVCDYAYQDRQCQYGCANSECAACLPACTNIACGPDPICGGSCGSCSQEKYCSVNGQCQVLSFLWQGIFAGDFIMGSPEDEPGRDVFSGSPAGSLDETPHHVTLSKDFIIAETEVTQADFVAIMGYNPSYFINCGLTCPVEQVSFSEAAAFCNQLSAGSAKPQCFECSGSGATVSCSLSLAYQTPYDCPGYRLPTEAEWGYAAGAGTQAGVFNGEIVNIECDPIDANLGEMGWYSANALAAYQGSLTLDCNDLEVSVGTQPVGQKRQNTWGLSDVNGNVWEWVLECSYNYTPADQANPLGPLECEDKTRIYRGGGLGNQAAYCRNAERASYACNDVRCKDIGFRPVRTLAP